MLSHLLQNLCTLLTGGPWIQALDPVEEQEVPTQGAGGTGSAHQREAVKQGLQEAEIEGWDHRGIGEVLGVPAEEKDSPKFVEFRNW